MLPGDRRVRVRGVQVHDQPLERAAAGQRVALNLTGVAVDDVGRGDVVVSAGADLRPGYLLDVELQFGDEDPEHGDRVQIHHGTREAPARLAWLGGRFWQVRLEQPLVAAGGDRLVVRQIAPPDTIGGGRVLDPRPRKHGPSRDLLTRLERLSRGEPPEPEPRPTPTRRCRRRPAGRGPGARAAVGLGARARASVCVRPGSSRRSTPSWTPPTWPRCARPAAPTRVTRSLHYHPDVLADVRRRVIAIAAEHGGSITLAQLRDELGTSRKFAQALLEHLDAEKVTIRRGDQHVVRRSALTG